MSGKPTSVNLNIKCFQEEINFDLPTRKKNTFFRPIVVHNRSNNLLTMYFQYICQCAHVLVFWLFKHWIKSDWIDSKNFKSVKWTFLTKCKTDVEFVSSLVFWYIYFFVFLISWQYMYEMEEKPTTCAPLDFVNLSYSISST